MSHTEEEIKREDFQCLLDSLNFLKEDFEKLTEETNKQKPNKDAIKNLMDAIKNRCEYTLKEIL